MPKAPEGKRESKAMMHEDDKEYLRKHSIHMMLNDLAKEIIERRPENPQEFVVEWLRKKDADSVDTISADNLHKMIEDGDDVVIIDCRPEGTDSIKNSTSIPSAEFPSHVANWVGKKMVVLYSSKNDGLANAAACCLFQTAAKASVSLSQVCIIL
eukprot:TRINITY_DN6922_c0_g1_i1.p1 TRINITY_DN6922_c0_g1~~TRINITY_DN6922_c0_g1_i1.p1  ORF type:complete len:155 (+),score=39.36 TRINITY_DN6922_c0_g1_i1:54-518(+)